MMLAERFGRTLEELDATMTLNEISLWVALEEKRAASRG
jgi:hypothetical protein